MLERQHTLLLLLQLTWKELLLLLIQAALSLSLRYKDKEPTAA
jgi:hypothetical protein